MALQQLAQCSQPLAAASGAPLCVRAVNLSQPDYNDMEKMFRSTVDGGIRLLRLPRQAAETALRAGRNLHGLVHCP